MSLRSRVLNYIISLLASSFIIASSAFAEDPSGCIVMAKKKLAIDVECKCLKTKSCATPRKLKYSEKFFSAKDENSKNLFSEKEKKAHKESYELFNKIMELKAKGLGSSEEIKALYFRLDNVNNELAILQHQNHPAYMKATKKRLEEKSKERKTRDARLKNRFHDLVSGKEGVASSTPVPAKVVEEKVVPVKEIKNETSVVAAPEKSVTQPTSPSGLSNEEKKVILNNVDKNKYEVSEEDSLFDIISKSYKSKAYKKLLAPAEKPEDAN